LSTLTKVLVLLVAVLSIFLCGVVVVYVASAQNYKTELERQKSLAQAAQVESLVAQESKANSEARLMALNDTLKGTIVALEKRNSELVQQNMTESKARMLTEGNSQVAVQLSKSLRDTIQNMYTAQKELQKELDRSHTEMLSAQAHAIELTRELNSEQVKSAQREATSRQRLEKIHQLEEENAQIRQRLQAVTLAPSDFQPGEKVSMIKPGEAGVPIRGSITDIKDDLAAISVGSSSGVRENMKFIVVRGDRYMGDLVITHVESTESAGRLSQRTGMILQGDEVTTGFN